MNPSQLFDWRNKRNLNIQTMNYSTYSLPDFTENKRMNGETVMYDSDLKSFSEMASDKKIDVKTERSEPWSIKTALHVCAMVFRKISGRASSPELSYHDCETSGQEAPPGSWQTAKTENKNIEAHTASFAYTGADMSGDYQSVVASCEDKLNKVRQLITAKPTPSSPKFTTYRSRRRRRVFVESSSVEDNYEDAFCPEDFVSESDSDVLPFVIPYQYQNCDFIEIDAPKVKIETPKMKIETPKMKIEAPATDKSEVTENKDLNIKPDIVKTEVVEHKQPDTEENKTNIATVSSCESKIMQLQAMLKERRKKNTKTMLNSSDSVTEPVKDLRIEQSKSKAIPAKAQNYRRCKDQNRLSTNRRKKVETKKMIQDDMMFADEIAESPSSYGNSPIIKTSSLGKSPLIDTSVQNLCENSPIIKISSLDKCPSTDTSVENLAVTPTEDCFDEVAGRFRTISGTESDDSFQVVFSDSPRAVRPSDCESEDSFIIFEDSPDSCYTSNDVFGDESESEYSDNDTDDSEISDSGCGDFDELKMSHKLAKSCEDLTDDRLYEGNTDVVDSAVRICEEIPNDDLDLDSVIEVKSMGMLLNDAKKKLRKDQPPKKVRFSDKPPTVRVMRVWAFAARQARAGHWERISVDRERFKRRIADVDMAVSWVLKPQHRSRVMFQRFMPWWNAQKRKELAEKKARAEEEKKRLEEEEKTRLEEERIKEEQRVDEERIKQDEEGESTEDSEGKINEKENISAEIKRNENEEKQQKEESKSVEKDQKNNQEKIKEEKRSNKNETNNVNDKLSVAIDKQNIGPNKEVKNNSGIVLDTEKTNVKDLNVTNKLNLVCNKKNHKESKKVKMEIVLKEDKCLIPVAVNSNKAVS